MTVELNPPDSNYTVMGTGPYAVNWAYVDGAVQVVVVLAGARTVLVQGVDYTVSPASSVVSGDVTLSLGAAASYDGATLYLSRETPTQQGWVGVLGEREKGLEAQLDVLTMRLQEVEQILDRSLRGDTPFNPFVPLPGAALIFDGSLQPVAGPTADAIAAAQGDAAAAHADRLAADAAAAAGAASAASAAAVVANADVTKAGTQTFTGVNTFANHLHIADDKSLFVGSDNDGELLYSTAGDKLIARAATAATQLSLRFNLFEIVNFTNTISLLRATIGGAVELFWNGLKRLETETAGVIVTGRLRETDRDAERWHMVAGRGLSTWYQNTTGRAIYVCITGLSTGSGSNLSLDINDTTAANPVATIHQSQPTARFFVQGRIPSGHYYRVTTSNGTTLDQWMELT